MHPEHLPLDGDASAEVIVVDNASPSGNVDSLKGQFPEIKLIFMSGFKKRT